MLPKRQLNIPFMDAASAMVSDSTNVVVNGKKLHIEFSDPVIMRKLGAGQFATVYHMRVEHDKSRYDFAVKEISLGSSGVRKSRIYQESEFGLRMSICPFAVSTYGIMGLGDKIRILMELMDDTVTNLCYMRRKLERDFSEEHFAFITKCVVKGLEFLRQCNIQHRDVKPSNMLVNRKGCVKICDYGVSQKMQGNITETNVGTFKFLAPERLGVGQKKGFRIQSDVWSLGVSVYNIVTESMPFPEDATIFDYHQYIITHPDVKLPNNNKYSQDLRQFVSSCLKVNEDDRPDYETLLTYGFLANIKISVHKPSFAQFVCETIDGYKKSLV